MNRVKIIRILEKCTKEPLRRNVDKYVVTLDVRVVNSILELLKEQESWRVNPLNYGGANNGVFNRDGAI